MKTARVFVVGFAGGLVGAIVAIAAMGAVAPAASRIVSAHLVEILDENGVRGMTLSAIKGDAMILMYNKRGERGAALTGGDSPALALHATGGGPTVFLCAGEEQAALGLHGKVKGKACVLVGVRATGTPWLTLRDGGGAVVWRAPQP